MLLQWLFPLAATTNLQMVSDQYKEGVDINIFINY